MNATRCTASASLCGVLRALHREGCLAQTVEGVPVLLGEALHGLLRYMRPGDTAQIDLVGARRQVVLLEAHPDRVVRLVG